MPQHPETFVWALAILSVGLVALGVLVAGVRRGRWAGETASLVLLESWGAMALGTFAVLVGLWLVLASYSNNWRR